MSSRRAVVGEIGARVVVTMGTWVSVRPSCRSHWCIPGAWRLIVCRVVGGRRGVVIQVDDVLAELGGRHEAACFEALRGQGLLVERLEWSRRMPRRAYGN